MNASLIKTLSNIIVILGSIVLLLTYILQPFKRFKATKRKMDNRIAQFAWDQLKVYTFTEEDRENDYKNTKLLIKDWTTEQLNNTFDKLNQFVLENPDITQIDNGNYIGELSLILMNELESR